MSGAQSKERENESEIAVVGAGLVGSLLALFLARRGFTVDVFERRPDMRTEKVAAGRSINLAISTRGITAMSRAGLTAEVLAEAVPMRGRMMHAKNGELTFQPYGKDDSECINSISRAALNKFLMTSAEKTGKVHFHFNEKAEGMDFERGILKLHNEKTNQPHERHADIVIGTDGSASKVREDMVKRKGFELSQSRLDYGYKELVIPPGPGGSFLMEKNALHIWPRGAYMLIALPNFDGSYTCTLFLPYKGEVSFENLTTVEQVSAFFASEFADAVPLIPDLAENFVKSPLGHMDTIKCSPWNVEGRALLLGDAAHAIVPFFGQGANCGFEDLTVLQDCIDEHLSRGGSLYIDHRDRGAADGDASDGARRRLKEGSSNWQQIFDDLTSRRKVNSDAIADMAVENFTEMRDRVADPHFLLMKAVEKILEKEFPGQYRSRYSLVTFSNAPYKLAQDVGIVCEEILNKLCSSIQKPEQVDLAQAEALIKEKLAPLLKNLDPAAEVQPVS
ncbi:MAG: FAD-dependent monooxygenase [Cyanobacteria bacterium SZAS LIN-2]|nr:FAD-dependent monooxygenase [Cyanobacteria bacterium SZAS LIN-2]